MLLAVHIMLHLKFCESAMVLKQMSGVLESLCTFYSVEFLHSGLVRFQIYCFILEDSSSFPHFLFHQRTIVTSETEQGIFEQVLHGDLDFDSDPWPSISESAKDLVKKMLVRDPRRRLTAHEVLC